MIVVQRVHHLVCRYCLVTAQVGVDLNTLLTAAVHLLERRVSLALLCLALSLGVNLSLSPESGVGGVTHVLELVLGLFV